MLTKVVNLVNDKQLNSKNIFKNSLMALKGIANCL